MHAGSDSIASIPPLSFMCLPVFYIRDDVILPLRNAKHIISSVGECLARVAGTGIHPHAFKSEAGPRGPAGVSLTVASERSEAAGAHAWVRSLLRSSAPMQSAGRRRGAS
jgi:hypothetical protein